MSRSPESQRRISWRYPIGLAIALPLIQVGRDLVTGKPDNYMALLAYALFAFAVGLGVEYFSKRRGRSS